uniref:LP09564p n=1 Tax=Drosophila melanogaster TaxID=7227 RepID=Q8MST6_DROME|nr:LP09564p [Drosophila melanogaster]
MARLLCFGLIDWFLNFMIRTDSQTVVCKYLANYSRGHSKGLPRDIPHNRACVCKCTLNAK